MRRFKLHATSRAMGPSYENTQETFPAQRNVLYRSLTNSRQLASFPLVVDQDIPHVPFVYFASMLLNKNSHLQKLKAELTKTAISLDQYSRNTDYVLAGVLLSVPKAQGHLSSTFLEETSLWVIRKLFQYFLESHSDYFIETCLPIKLVVIAMNRYTLIES
ncbi:hypothetical protein ACU8KH_01411 [Lachancea thermotolerans]